MCHNEELKVTKKATDPHKKLCDIMLAHTSPTSDGGALVSGVTKKSTTEVVKSLTPR